MHYLLLAILLGLSGLPAQAQYRDPITPSQLRQVQLLVQQRACYDAQMHFCELEVSLQGSQIVIKGKVTDSEQKLFVLAGFHQLGYALRDQLEVFPYKDVAVPYGQVQSRTVDGYATPEGMRTTQYLFGSYLRILKRQTDWSLVQSTQDQYISWIRHRDILPLSQQKYEQLTTQFDSIMVRTQQAKLYQDEALQTPLKELPLATRLPLVQESANHWKVLYPGAKEPQTGYIAKREARLFVPHQGEGTQALVESARLYGLTPWLAGGASVEGWDSAAFIQTLYRLQGIQLPREARQQQRLTLHIRNPEQTKVGDLVFYQGHTGLILGDKRFIYLPPQAKQAVIARLDSEKYRQALSAGELSFGRVTVQNSL